MLALDTETTGFDLRHGCKPYFVSICRKGEDGNEEVTSWQWEVDPTTRDVKVDKRDLRDIQQELEGEKIILQNAKFDVTALAAIDSNLQWDWSKTEDTLLAAHLLDSDQFLNLTDLASRYLGVDVKRFESKVEEVTKKARSIARSKYPHFRIADKSLPEMPSAKEKVWKADMWLPKVIADEEGYPKDDPFYTALEEYGENDPTVTYMLYEALISEIERRGLEDIYYERVKILPIVYGMEAAGVTFSEKRLEEAITVYGLESEEIGERMTTLASTRGFELKLPKGGNNKSLLDFAEYGLGLGRFTDGDATVKHANRNAREVSWSIKNSKLWEEKSKELAEENKGKPGYSAKTGRISLSRPHLLAMLEHTPFGSEEGQFITDLLDKRRRDTALSYMESYKRFALPFSSRLGEKYSVLYPSLNSTGTHTLRWSSSNPNEQNISKQEGFNIRYVFGPAPGREWWSLDAKNIELRIPAYEAGEEEMVQLFERPNDPPYYGSNHLLVFSILHPEKFKEYGAKCKEVYASTHYQWVKNGNFAVQYGAVESSGTADRAYGIKGAQARIQKRFSKIARLNKKMIAFANKHGYVETMPDKNVDSERGYPLVCTTTRWGTVVPTIPLNYHVQGTAMWWMMKAMIRCHEYLKELNSRGGKKYHMVMQVHDELVFDFPYKPNKGNLPKVKKIARLMEKGGDDIGIPTPVSIDYHPKNWSE